MRQKGESEVSISSFLFLGKLPECIVQADEWKKNVTITQNTLLENVRSCPQNKVWMALNSFLFKRSNTILLYKMEHIMVYILWYIYFTFTRYHSSSQNTEQKYFCDAFQGVFSLLCIMQGAYLHIFCNMQ